VKGGRMGGAVVDLKSVQKNSFLFFYFSSDIFLVLKNFLNSILVQNFISLIFKLSVKDKK
jgi:hypothetical protein